MTNHFPELHKDQCSPDVAFDRAIALDVLSSYHRDDNFAGNYVFMGRMADGRLAFKHRDTRAYIYAGV